MGFSKLGLFIVFMCAQSLASYADTLTIISPHRKSIQQEFVPLFEKHYKDVYKTDVKIDWIDQGGTSDDIRFVRSKFKNNPKSAGIDIFWGGGTATFLDLENDKSLDAYTLPKELDKELPTEAAGVPLRSKGKFWYATALSSFGIFYNKKILTVDRLPTPLLWEDIANAKFQNLISLTDPRRSGTATVMNDIVLHSKGWEKGWELLTQIAGNTRAFTHSSSDPIKAVTSGDAAASMVIDFYAFAKIADLGEDNLGFALPQGQTVLDPDPIAILKGAPNRVVAERFVNFVLSKDAQKLLVLGLGKPDGPKLSALGRMSVNTKTYAETEGQRITELNPFKQKGYLKVDLASAAKTNQVLNDLFGAIIVDVHKELKEAWIAINKKNASEKIRQEFSRVPITESEMNTLAATWNNEVNRNKKINEWVTFAREKYKKVTKDAMSH